MESDKPTRVICFIIAMDPTSFCYKACSNCESPIPDSHSSCNKCKDRRYPLKRLFRLFLSIVTDSRVDNVVCFDKAAQFIFGCSAQQFFEFAALHPNAAKTARDVLIGEPFHVTLCKPKSNAEHLRMTGVVPLSSDFEPVIETLKEVYRVNAA